MLAIQSSHIQERVALQDASNIYKGQPSKAQKRWEYQSPAVHFVIVFSINLRTHWCPWL